MSLRKALGKIIGPSGRRLIWRLEASVRARPYRHYLKKMCAIEIGGPSNLFGVDGELPIYSCLRWVDNVNYSTNTLWQSDAVQLRKTLICEGTELPVKDQAYDCLISSHSLEHIANPIKALLEWRRVIREGGFLLLVLPNREFTFDWRRPVTSMDHLRQDFEHDTPETDLFHLDEILALHDLSRDLPAGTPEQFRERCLKNAEFRAIHHHVFDAERAAQLVKEVGFSIVRQDVKEVHIITLATKS
ncbi:MAG: methyltransferase domain-containing protein [Acidobacteriaceae bacterium]